MEHGEPSAGGVAGELWQECRSLAMDCLRHPFMAALGRGDLPKQCFADYVAQDVFYLDAFASAYAAAAEKAAAERLPPHVAGTLRELRAGVLEEVRLHASYARRLGVPAEAMRAPNPATLRYTTFLQQAAEQRDVAHILAAMTPCSRLYAFLGCQLAQQHPGHAHAFSEWVATYSGAAYCALPDRKERLLNALAEGRAPEPLLELYRTAMELELQFFEAHRPASAEAAAGDSPPGAPGASG